MKLSHVIEAVYWHPWFITQAGHSSVRQTVERKLAMTYDDASKAAKSISIEDVLGKPPERGMVGSVARIPIVGTLARGISPIEKACGVRDYKAIADDLEWALESSAAESILLYIDSPGGAVNGCHECYQQILEAGKIKKVYAYTEGQICSAAYYLASACESIIATPSSFIGSIGVILQVLDSSKLYEASGLKMHTLRSGPLKAPGMEGDEITEEQLRNLQDLVNGLADQFKGTVSQHRPLISEESMQGQVFRGSEASDLGFVDWVVNSEREAMSLLN